MTTILLMQRIDTILLVAIMVCGLIIFREDKELSLPCRALVMIGAFGCFAQATWLQGYWMPSAAGYPWASLMRDFSIAGLASLRAVRVLQRLYGFPLHRLLRLRT